MISLYKPLIDKHGTVEKVSKITGIPMQQLKDIFCAKERPSGYEVNQLCKAIEMNSFYYNAHYGNNDYDLHLEYEKNAAREYIL